MLVAVVQLAFLASRSMIYDGLSGKGATNINPRSIMSSHETSASLPAPACSQSQSSPPIAAIFLRLLLGPLMNQDSSGEKTTPILSNGNETRPRLESLYLSCVG